MRKVSKPYLIEIITGLAVENRTVRIISIEKLLQMKTAIQPPREKDKSDISALKKIMERES